MEQRQFGWKPRPEDKRDYRLANYISPEKQKLADEIPFKEWEVRRILDQGQTPHCVGFAWAQFGITLPVFQNWYDQKGHDIYYQAKVEDGQAGQENGSDTRSGAKAFMKCGGKLKDNVYAFASTLREVITWVKTTGPVVVGTLWLSEMSNPDADGVIHIGGGVEGGHEYILVGADDEKQRFKVANSWGVFWGLRGFCYLSYSDFSWLLYHQGDACTTVEVEGDPEPPEPPDPDPLDPIKAIIQFFVDWIVWFFQWLFGKTPK